MNKDDDFLNKLQEMFNIEANEHLQTISSGLLQLEKGLSDEEQKKLIETTYREAHSLKGAARSVDLVAIETICHAFESVFSALKSDKIALSPILFDLLHQTTDLICEYIASPESVQPKQISDLIQRLIDAEKGTFEINDDTQQSIQSPEETPNKIELNRNDAPTSIEIQELGTKSITESDIVNKQVLAYQNPHTGIEKPAMSETVRIATSRLDTLLLQAEEMVSVKLAMNQRAIECQDIKAMFGLCIKELSKVNLITRDLQPLLDKRDKQNDQVKLNYSQLAKLLEFLDWGYEHIKLVESKVTALAKSSVQDYRSLGGLVDSFLDNMKKTLMFPFSLILEGFPKIVRDLARNEGKNVELMIYGGEVEIEKHILELMKDPLIHLIRNSIDHGIEKPEGRTRKNKPSSGTIIIAVSQMDTGKVEICISDDGIGIDSKKVKEAAVQRGIISSEEANKLNEHELLMLIFQSDVSTSPIVTDISGRGLGLAIVRERVEQLNGSVSVETTLHIGTVFRILIPVTLATFRGILVNSADFSFIIPSSNVERSLRINKDDVKTVENKETIILNASIIPLVRLDDVLEISRKEKNDSEHITVLVLGSGDKRIAFSVDAILNEQEVMVKSLGKQLSRVRNIAGATILGSGKVVPILNVTDLMKSAVKADGYTSSETSAGTKIERKSILIAEDSITSRMLLKNILESVGYSVRTAVDGVDAFMMLKEGEFDLVVSDIEMPRMNGFDLVLKVRNDKRLGEMPIVLVTGLGSRESRERGIEVGANAYIVKSSFDQSNLLDVIQKLI
jgi:two-component system chemotaxis sensor kinase CheA